MTKQVIRGAGERLKVRSGISGYSYWTWWINQFPSANPLRAGFFVMVQIEETIFSWKEAPSDFFC